jgi:hypothetical protein
MKNLKKVKYFIFCSGKTGSQTLSHGFIKKFGNDSFLHVHSDSHFKQAYPTYGDIKNILIENSKIFDKIYIIDSYREPIERSIASFFQNIDKNCPDWKKFSVEELVQFFNNNELYFLETYHSYYKSWGYFNLDININFNFDKGYIKKELDNIVFVKTRLKEVYRWNKIFSDILNTNIEFGYDNNSINKPYFEKYNNFKKFYTLPNIYKEKFIETMNISKDKLNTNDKCHLTWIEMKKMMTLDEVTSYLKKWKIT